MSRRSERRHAFGGFLEELFFYSGQYAFYYILLHMSRSFFGFFLDAGHVLLLCLLIVQTAVLSRWGSRPGTRFLGSLIVPAFYSFQEALQGLQFFLDIGHVFFWVFSLAVASLQALLLKTRSTGGKRALEFAVTFLNIFTFLFLYFYLDLKLDLEEKLAAGIITLDQLREGLEFYNMGEGFRDFLADPAHIFIIAGGSVLGASLALGRMKIISLKDRINELFGRYVDRDIRDRIIESTGAPSEERDLCILFSDIRDFTTLCEASGPEAITGMLNRYFTLWENIVVRHHGVVDKFVGDAIMVLFGLKGGADPREAAVSCGREVLARLGALKAELLADGKPAFERIGVGIHYGPVIVGDIGSPNRMNFTVIGDNVNTASRLESLCKESPHDLIVSATVYDALSGDAQVSFESLGSVSLKGRKQSVAAYGLKKG